MVILEIVSVFHGRHSCLYDHSVVSDISDWYYDIFLSFSGLAFVIIRAAMYGDPVAGWPSLVCIISLHGGLILLCLGIIGLYLSKIYLETKKRQIYIIREQG